MGNIVETKPLNIEEVDFDDDVAMAVLEEAWATPGRAKLQQERLALREMGIIDDQGNQLRTIMPADMLDPDADFGG